MYWALGGGLSWIDGRRRLVSGNLWWMVARWVRGFGDGDMGLAEAVLGFWARDKEFLDSLDLYFDTRAPVSRLWC